MKKAFDISDSYMAIINEKFLEKRKVAAAREKQLFGILDQDISHLEAAALKFLFAYMPLNDMADYNGDLFLQHVRKTLNIREKTPWGFKIPDQIFLHFVLPYRVNNENIEDSREILFDELFDRVKNLSMYEAILEVNHWCHEKATYIGTDPRTASPLTVIRTALGRCGEQSTLAVAALRSLCIPARQCYTPRWAHCDSNHAWVEAWADGNWYYFGACEPEPRLNRGWFTGPARRAMLVNTRVPANYSGPEEITLAHKWYTEINLLDNYAINKKITVNVKDNDGKPVDGANVSFEVYNFAEFSPIARLTSGTNGSVSLTTGLGDLMIHASSDKGWGFKKISVKDTESIDIVIGSEPPADGIIDLDMVPPPEIHLKEDEISEEERQENDRRLKEEDRIRKEYESTFISEEQSYALAKDLMLPPDRVWNVLKKARGNSHELAAFLMEEVPRFGLLPLVLLESLADKDLTDSFRKTLKDHLEGSLNLRGSYEDDIFASYILCPRVGHEMIAEYRAFFQQQFLDAEKEKFRKNPADLVDWIDCNVQVMEGYTYYQGSATPRGTYELRKGDRMSRNILFVAMARSFGIPARLEPADKRPQFMLDGIWKDAFFNIHENTSRSKDQLNAAKFDVGKIKLVRGENCDGKIEYFSNFSLARFENGLFKTLDYRRTDLSIFERSVEVLAGHYRLITGTRLGDGTALARVTFFTVKPGEMTEIKLDFRSEERRIPILGTVQQDCSITLADGRIKRLDDLIGDKGMVIAWIEPDREPSKHLIREFKELSGELNGWGGKVCICVGDDKLTSSFAPENYEGMPALTDFIMDCSYQGLACLTSGLNNFHSASFPMVFVMDENRNIRYASYGYKLGIGTEVIKILKSIKQHE